MPCMHNEVMQALTLPMRLPSGQSASLRSKLDLSPRKHRRVISPDSTMTSSTVPKGQAPLVRTQLADLKVQFMLKVLPAYMPVHEIRDLEQ